MFVYFEQFCARRVLMQIAYVLMATVRVLLMALEILMLGGP